MSVTPQQMAMMLASGLGGQGTQTAPGGVAVQQPPTGQAAQMIQKIMLMKALQGQPQQPQMPPTGPGGFPLPPGQALPQAANAQAMPGGVNA